MDSSSSPPPPPEKFPIPVAAPPPLEMLAITPELCNALLQELEPSVDDDPFLAQCLRQTQLQLTTLAAPPASVPHLLLPLSQHQEQQGHPLRGEPSGSNPSGTRRRVSSSGHGLVRVSHISSLDQFHYSALVRRARLGFQALRGAYQRQEAAGGNRNRPDMRAYSMMLASGLCHFHDGRIVGNVPGVFVGDTFFHRTELCVAGLHSSHMAGIGYIPASHVDEGVPIAASIVSSGGYPDSKDLGEVLYYSSGGRRERDHNTHVQSAADQTVDDGNLALHNSYVYGVEVRVIRGHDCDLSPSGKVFVYDGLYKVIDSNFGPGKSGHDVCTFRLLRVKGQPEMGSKIWKKAEQLKDKMDRRIRPRRYISLDLSKKAEAIRVPVCNEVDDDTFPLQFEYIVRPNFPVPVKLEMVLGCNCELGCALGCSCQRKNNGGGLVYNADGTLVMGRPVVYECGALCGCPMACVNRVTQRGIKHRLEVFRSSETGAWALRTLDLIKPGSFVCEYTGEVVAREALPGNHAPVEGTPVIDPLKFPPRWREWGDSLAMDPNIPKPQFAEFAGPGYVLDVSRKVNVACYIGHCCNPNVFLQFVVHGNEDESFPRMMVFAMETIPPMRELSIDYGTCTRRNQCACFAGSKATV